jgi:glutamate carboxypeptidase
VIAGGYTPNTVAGDVEAQMSFRFERQSDGDELMTAIKDILETPALHNDDLDIRDETTYKIEAFIPPMELTDTSQTMIDIVLEEAEQLGHNVVPIARGGGSDANYICASGVPSICGMGAPCQDIHTTDEKIHLPMLFERIVLLIRTVQRVGDLSKN